MSNLSPNSDIFSFIKQSEMHPEEIAKKYPWCSIAQISLLQYYKINNSTAFDKQANKTAMVFNNSSWLNWQLHQVSQQTNKV